MASKKKITGITIEINGDTTKLDKALAATDKASKTTTANLKDVERLLKLDPTNVELLAQKQDYLSQRVEQTSDRYQALKAALEQSTASNVKFDEWEKAQASLQGQITKTEKAIQSLETEQQKLIDLGFSVVVSGPVAGEWAPIHRRALPAAVCLSPIRLCWAFWVTTKPSGRWRPLSLCCETYWTTRWPPRAVTEDLPRSTSVLPAPWPSWAGCCSR